MLENDEIKVAVLIDLLRSSQSGGHVKGWERIAQAAARSHLPLRLTVYFCGEQSTEALSPAVTIRQLPQVLSTQLLKFLPYIPDHTDLAPYHPVLARELKGYDTVHTTDAFFAMSKTALRMKRQSKIGLTHSFHTDQPSYAQIFMTKAIRERLPRWAQNFLIDRWRLPERKADKMRQQYIDFLKECDFALATRESDLAFARQSMPATQVRHVRLGVDKNMFNPQRADRPGIMARYGIPDGRLIVMFVGRLDEGKNIYTLIKAVAELVKDGLPLHLVTAGIGPAADDVRAALPNHASVLGFVAPEDLARLYASADVLALTSEVEVRSMAMVESLACGLPVLIAAKSGVHRLFPASPALEVVTGGVEAWIDALRQFATAEKQKIMTDSAQHFAVHHVASWEQVLAEDYMPIWREAAALHRRSG